MIAKNGSTRNSHFGIDFFSAGRWVGPQLSLCVRTERSSLRLQPAQLAVNCIDFEHLGVEFSADPLLETRDFPSLVHAGSGFPNFLDPRPTLGWGLRA